MNQPDASRAIWRKSRRSGNGNNCVEVAAMAPTIGVRDSKSPGGGHLLLTRPAWAAFAASIKAGQYDR